MNKFMKIAAAATMTGALALALATPSEARDGRNAAAIGGFAAGAVVGAAVVGSANSNYYGRPGYYQRGYAYQPGYDYDEPGYAYEPAYAYEPRYAPSYDAAAVAPYPYQAGPRYYGRSRGTAACGGSPGSVNFRPCDNQ